MNRAAEWRPLITSTLARVWPALPNGPDWIQAQVQQESGGDPRAVSKVGAAGLMQLMPGTADELGVKDRFSPIESLDGGIRYLRIQYEHLAEIQRESDRLYWSFASFNGGRGFCNQAFVLARKDGEQPWWQWDIGRNYLMHRDCIVSGKHPDYLQMWTYVSAIIRNYSALVAA